MKNLPVKRGYPTASTNSKFETVLSLQRDSVLRCKPKLEKNKEFEKLWGQNFSAIDRAIQF